MIDVVWLTPTNLDQFFIRDVISGEVWDPVQSFEFRNVDSFKEITGNGAVVVLPGGFYKPEFLNEHIKSLEWVVIILVSDERNTFDTSKIEHTNYKLWVQTPRVGTDYGDARLFGDGYAYAREHVKGLKYRYDEKAFDVFLSGQNTHHRRNTIFQKLHDYERSNKINGFINETPGFTQGFPPEEYYSHLANSKVAPAPSGVYSPDSFRLYESLELGVVPIPDDVSPIASYDSIGYWDLVFPGSPLQVLQDDNIASLLNRELGNTESRTNEIFSWWMGQKRRYAYDLHDDIGWFVPRFGPKLLRDRITVIVPVSPWKSHPSTEILDETLESIRYHLPTCEIIVTFDGVRREQEDRRSDYEKFVKGMLWKINNDHKNVLPIVFKKHAHQVGMMREALKHVRTGSVLYVEGDSPLSNKNIHWDQLADTLDSGMANIIRLYNKHEIPPEHEYLMDHENEVKTDHFRLLPSWQWSQQPHLATTEIYKHIMEFFSDGAVSFIEDKIYYPIANDGKHKHSFWRLFIYFPNDNEPRSYHLDGRSGEPKWDDRQVF